jgi:transposase
MGRTRRGFTPEYKDEAVKLVINTGRTVATVARELGLKEQTLGRWVHDFKARAAGGGARPRGRRSRPRRPE